PAELTWALVLAASRHLVPYATHLREGEWQRSGLDRLGRAVQGRVLGIWGYGRIGSLVARYADAVEMDVLVWGSERGCERARADGHDTAGTKAELFERADVLTLHLRLTESTAGCVTAADLARMKPTALLVNTARAELVQQGALLVALDAGR